MWARSKTLRVIERALFVFGLLLLIVFSLAHIHRFVMFRAEIEQFHARQTEVAGQTREATVVSGDASLYRTRIDYSLWSAQRARLHQANLGTAAETLAVLRIPRLQLEVPVLEGTDEFTLNRGVGRIAGTSRPGEAGNVGIAGHRDGFFRSLKDINLGDTIELVTISETHLYAVDRVRVTNPADVGVLRPTKEPSLTLVTCYPFYFVGPAPKRYVVQASLKEQGAQEDDRRIISTRRRKP